MPIRLDDNLQAFLDEYRRDSKTVVFFVGAGLSQPLFPSWRTFLRTALDAVASDAPFPNSRSEARAMIEAGQNYLELAQVIAQSLGDKRWHELLGSTFDRDFVADDIPLAYRELFELRPPLIITTNYDRIPEVLGAGTYRMFTARQALEANNAINSGKPTVFMPHGAIGDHASVVLKRDHYDQIMHHDQSTGAILRTVFYSKTVIFLGFSLTDPHFDLVLSAANATFRGKGVAHYALIPDTSALQATVLEHRYGVLFCDTNLLIFHTQKYEIFSLC